MFITKVVEPELKPRYTRFSDMEEGQIGRIVAPLYKGAIVMRIYDKIISLSSGSSYWNRSAALDVELLRPGTTVTLTVTERG